MSEVFRSCHDPTVPAITVRPATADDLIVLGDILTNLHGRTSWSPGFDAPVVGYRRYLAPAAD